MINRTILLYSFFLLVMPLDSLCAAKEGVIRNNEIIIQYEVSLRDAAEKVERAYPAVKEALIGKFRWGFDFVPTILLIRDRELFRKRVESDNIVAFAVPQYNLIVIDYSRMGTGPFTLETTMKHESCHLLLHHNIRDENLPRWLDEGICQWVSDGMAEIMTTQDKAIENATLSQKLIPLRQLAQSFPKEEKSLVLAYEESRSVVDYINEKFGVAKLIDLLEYLKGGLDLEDAVVKSFSVSMDELEMRWRGHLEKRITWITYMSNNLYEILFLLAGMISIYGFIRIMIRRKAYRDQDDDDGRAI